MNESKRLIRNTGIIAVGNISTKLVSFVLLPLYTAILSSEEYGVFDYVIAIATFVVPFITLMMDESIFRFLIDCRTEEDKKRVVSQSVAIMLSGVAVFVVACEVIFGIWHYDHAQYLIAYVLSLVCCSLINPLLRGFGMIKAYAAYNFVLSSSTVVLNVLFIAVLSLGLKGMFLATIIAHFLVSVVFAAYGKVWKYIDFRTCSWKSSKEMIRYSLPLIPNKVSWSIINLSDRIVITQVLGSGAAGMYAIAHKFPNLMDMVYGFFYQSWKESSARVLDSEERERFYNTVYAHIKHFMFAVVICMIAFMPLAFKILINEKFAEAILYVPALMLATYFSNISGFYGGVFTAYKDTKIMGTSTVLAAAADLALHLVMIRFFGLYAGSIAALLANLVAYGYRRLYVKKYIRLKENTKETLLAIGVLAVVAGLFYSMNVWLQAVGCAIALVYAVATNRALLFSMLKGLKKA